MGCGGLSLEQDTYGSGPTRGSRDLRSFQVSCFPCGRVSPPPRGPMSTLASGVTRLGGKTPSGVVSPESDSEAVGHSSPVPAPLCLRIDGTFLLGLTQMTTPTYRGRGVCFLLYVCLE